MNVPQPSVYSVGGSLHADLWSGWGMHDLQSALLIASLSRESSLSPRLLHLDAGNTISRVRSSMSCLRLMQLVQELKVSLIYLTDPEGDQRPVCLFSYGEQVPFL